MYSAESLKQGAAFAFFSAHDYYQDALFNFKGQRFAACVCLMTTAREEIGKARLLHKKAISLGAAEEITGEAVRKLINDHNKKLRMSLGTISVPIPQELLLRFQTAIQEQDSSGTKAASDEIQKISQAKRTALPKELHKLRLVAQYVDAVGNGRWTSREKIQAVDCYQELINLGNEVFSDAGHFLDEGNFDSELNRRGINQNSIHGLLAEHMAQTYQSYRTALGNDQLVQ